MATERSRRLPGSVKPARYQLILTPNLEDFTFLGEATIELQVLEPTPRITLNASELDIGEARLTLPDGSTLQAESIDLNEEAETATLVFPSTLHPAPSTRALTFTGQLNDQLRGFYRSQYTAADGQQRFLASTQFEATDARRAFPCWDEPAIKATFQVTLIIPADLAAISNMPVAGETPRGDGTKAVRFAESPPMSAYLLALLVGDLTSVEARAPGGTLVRVWTTRGKEDQGRFALESAIGLLGYFNEYFGIPYPLPKLDHVAVPDFAAGAMENWGAITYRETALLFDPANSAAYARQRIVEVIAHEMAHMWFGDLVTMEWWDDLWLNESFASWMGDKAVDHLHPEWHMWTQFVSQDTNSGLSLDGLRNSHPIEVPVQDPAEIREIFDAISYSKGGAVLRMLEAFLGAEAIRQGLHAYLSAHRYAHARTEDLWHALERASGQPVTSIMNTWVKQAGYPVLRVQTQRQDASTRLTLAQRRFLYDHLLDGGEDDPTLWQIPVTIAAGPESPVATALMTGRETTLALPPSPSTLHPAPWAKLNAGQTGFYRVDYAEDEWQRLQSAVAVKQLPATDRLGLQNDAYALARAGYVPATRFLTLAGAYLDEDDASVWGDLSANLRGLENLLFDEPFLAEFQAFGARLYRPIVSRVGWDARPEEGHLDILLRGTVLSQLGAYGDPGTIGEARGRFARYVEDPALLHPDLRGVVIGLVGQEGDEAIYRTLWEVEERARLQEEKIRLLMGLARFRQPELLAETLRRSLNPDDVRSQDTVLVITAVAGNRYGRDLAWQFVQENWAELDRRYGRGGFAISRLVGMTGAFTTLVRAREVEAFFQAHPAPSAARTIQQSLERIRLNARWLDLNRQPLATWFAAHS
ncbi:MAG: M1 family metallopeptidase [Chloroflexi bacterium]|nr:M1 family metallopeptidase [Chloroflexota bacterium]